MVRKRRPREHIIEDLSAQHVQQYVLECGYSMERVQHDYGYDCIVSTYNEKYEIENGFIYLQLKATDTLKVLRDGTIAFRLDRADLELWLGEPFPVILIVYDTQANLAYWLYVQAYFQALSGFNLQQIGKTTTVRISSTNIVDEAAFRKFAQYKNNVIKQLHGKINHHA